MDRIAKGQRVGVTVNELDERGKRRDIAPRFFGEVIEAADDGQSGYVRIDGEDDGRTHFHASELEPEPKAAKKK
jgi:predicted lipoprotein